MLTEVDAWCKTDTVQTFEPINHKEKAVDFDAQIALIQKDFALSRKLLAAMGDETRQQIVTVLMEAECEGMRVGEITARTHLSRPAVSHHIGILLACGLVGVDKQGTKNFYYLDIGDDFQNLRNLVNRIWDFKIAAEKWMNEEN